MKKKFTALLLAALLCTLPFSALADATFTNAKTLFDLGLLKGTGGAFSYEGLELGRNATRAEVCTTIVRMLGKEKKAAYQQNAHPFSDVPAWASDNIGWLYENYLVSGISDTYFGAMDIATVQQFSTMLLRVLGFDDSRGDFSFDSAVSFAQHYGLLTPEIASRYELSRADMINMCYCALMLNLKNSNRKLIVKLCDERAVIKELAESAGLLKEASLSDSFPGINETLGNITAKKINNRYVITLSSSAEEYGLRVYVREAGKLMKEVPLSNRGDGLYMKKSEIYYPGGSRAGYVSELYVYGLDTSKSYSFIVIKTTSEGELYKITGKSSVAES